MYCLQLFTGLSPGSQPLQALAAQGSRGGEGKLDELPVTGLSLSDLLSYEKTKNGDCLLTTTHSF